MNNFHTLLKNKPYWDQMAMHYNRPGFIANDPVQIPHLFSKKEDIEISGFLTAILSWGQRKTIINNALRLMNLMDNQPYEFITNHSNKNLKALDAFCHRTFNAHDLKAFIHVLHKIYQQPNGFENIFTKPYAKQKDIKQGIINLRKVFEASEIPRRTLKHVANIEKGSSAKRINMYLRWMVRNDNCGVDFGLWRGISPADLYIPLDVHTGTTARKNQLLLRKQNDWRAVEELTQNLRKMDANDPVKYDFALFGIGADGV